MSEGEIENEKAIALPLEASAKVENAQLSRWLRRAGLIALGTAGSLAVAIGAASYPLSGLLIRP